MIPKPVTIALRTIKALKGIQKYHKKYVEAKKNGEEINVEEIAKNILKKAKLPEEERYIKLIVRAIKGDIEGLKEMLREILPSDAIETVEDFIDLITEELLEE